VKKAIIGGLAAVAAAISIPATVPAQASVNGYMTCMASALRAPRLDESWVSVGQYVQAHLNAGASPGAEMQSLVSKGLAPDVARAVVQCVMKNPL
jgi:hypothetical protein